MVGDNKFDEQQLCARTGDGAHVAQDAHCVIIRPVVNDVFSTQTSPPLGTASKNDPSSTRTRSST
jgi:hypothetical protein